MAKPLWRWRGLLGEARTRILVWYVVLMLFSGLASVIAIRQILYTRLEEQIGRSLVQEVEEFKRLVGGRNPATGKLFANDIAAIFRVFLNRNIPDNDEFLITLVDNEFYMSSPRALPEILREDDFAVLKRLAKLDKPQQGQVVAPSGETVFYQTEPLIRGSKRGVFVVVYTVARARKEINAAVLVVIEVTIAVLAVASILAWAVAGRILAPLRLLTATAHTISESDLTQRIVVQGDGEIAEIATTFNEMLDRLQSAFNSQRDLINDAGHELRTPITIIRGHLELMGNDPDEQRETIDLVLDELDRMSRLVSDLLLLAKAERPDFLRPKTLELGALTEELYAKARALADRDWRLDIKGAGYIVADRQRLTEAIMNLAQNATQHTQVGDVIALGSTIRNRQVRFWVRDRGEGIAVTDQQRIFERFARATSHRSERAGLGLAIVRAIAEAHQGQVELHSQLGRGSTFTLIMPLASSQEKEFDESHSHH